MPRSSRSSTSTFSGRSSSAPRCCSPSAARRRPLFERPRRGRWRVRRGSERPPGPAARDRSSRRSARRELRADPRVHPGRMGGLPGLDLRELRHDVADLVRAGEQHPPGERVDREVDRRAVRQEDSLLGEVHGELRVGFGGEQVEEPGVRGRVQDHRQDTVLERVDAEDDGEGGGEDCPNHQRRERPRCVLARGAGPEVVADQQDPAAGHPGPVQHEAGLPERPVLVEAPVTEERVGEAGLVGDLQVARRDDLVRVHVLRAQRDDPAGELAERLAHVQFPPPTVAGVSMPGSVRGSVTTPLIALAAAVIGEARNVRPPFPWRPSKLRLLVLIAYWPGRSWSPFIAMHMEQPASRHSAPAARKTSWSPSRSAWAFTCWEPETTIRRTPSATCWPRRMLAASLRSLIRPFMQLPMKTTSTGWPAMAWPGRRSMYSSACSSARRAPGSAAPAGSGTRPLTGIPIPGFVP